MQPKLPLNVCCLRRFRMVPWRSTNDVKVRAVIRTLKLGIHALVVDLDATVTLQALAPHKQFPMADVVYVPRER